MTRRIQATFKVQNDALGARVRAASDAGRLATIVSGALLAEAHAIMAESLPQVPVDSGDLRDSRVVGTPEISKGGVAQITFGYGGVAKDYAWPQHERTDYQHTVGKAHYLSDPVRARAGNFAVHMRGHLERILG